MSNKEKKETINRVMHLLRCGKISASTPNKDVWKHFTFDNDGWISTADDMPPHPKNDTNGESDRVMFSTAKTVFIGTFDWQIGVWWAEGCAFDREDVTHWKVLKLPRK